ncbi:MAG: hypothetical protein ACPGOY_16570 [Rhodospirillaceae bacterium]
MALLAPGPGAYAQSVPPMASPIQTPVPDLFVPVSNETVDFRYVPTGKIEYQTLFEDKEDGTHRSSYTVEVVKDGNGFIIERYSNERNLFHKYHINEKGKLKRIVVGRDRKISEDHERSIRENIGNTFPAYLKGPKKIGDMVAMTEIKFGRHPIQLRHIFQGEGTKGRSSKPGYILKTMIVHSQSGWSENVGYIVVDKETFLPLEMRAEFGDLPGDRVLTIYRK